MRVILRNSTLVFQTNHIEHLPFLDAKPGWQSADFVTININASSNIATIAVDYDHTEGASAKIASLAIGTVGDLKNQTTYLYMSDRLTNIYCCKNRYEDWNNKYLLSGFTVETITGGYKIVIPPSMFEGLEDTDVIWFLTGQNTFVTKTFNAFISTSNLDAYTERT